MKGYRLPIHNLPKQDNIPYQKFSITENKLISASIDELLQLGAIEKCKPCTGQFVSKIFLRDKPNGKKRFILNLKSLNTFLNTKHFKMEDYRTATRLVQRDMYLACIDIKDAYFVVKIDSRDRKFLRFRHNGIYYQFTCLPFGLSSAPYCFTKLVKPVVEHMRIKGILCVNYLDDFLLLAQTEGECYRDLVYTTNLLESLGFVINHEKSTLVPSKNQKFLGFNFDTNKMTLELPLDKKLKILKLVHIFQNRETCKIRELAKFIGTLISACPAVKYGWLYMKALEREKVLALSQHNENYDILMRLSATLSPDLSWWKRNILNAYNDIKQDSFCMEIFTDASLTGWGACVEDQKTNGWWTDADKKHHINFLELKAIFYGLKCFAKDSRDSNLLIRTDNTTAASYINRMGSIQYLTLCKEAKEIWQWCEGRNIWLFASYISSEENRIADQQSRIVAIETEWCLSIKCFKKIITKFGKPDIDLFASKANAKCNKYISWKKDPDSVAIDAFTIAWSNFNFYAFPPFSIVLRVLQKIITDQAEGILVVPLWPSQPWYPLFSRLKQEEIIFKPDINLLSSPFRKQHPLATTLSLVAARLSGKPSCRETYRMMP